MDWNKTKSIFIVVFLVLNVFLYSLYLNRLNEAKNIEVPGEETVEAGLRQDNITYSALPNIVESAAYISGKIKTFSNVEFPYTNQTIQVKNGTNITSVFSNPVKLRDVDDQGSFTEFLQDNVMNGMSYELWEVNKEKRYAVFFQRIDSSIIYYNQGGFVKIYWNEDDKVYKYEQTMLEHLEELEQKEEILPPFQVIQALYSKGLLKQNSRITNMELGYSTLVQLTQTQVFVPTWEVRVKSKDEEEEFFVNAVEGKVIDIQNDLTKAEIEEEK